MLDGCVVMMNMTRIVESYFNTVLDFKKKTIPCLFSTYCCCHHCLTENIILSLVLATNTFIHFYCRCIFQSILNVIVVVIVINVIAIVVVNISLCYATKN